MKCFCVECKRVVISSPLYHHLCLRPGVVQCFREIQYLVRMLQHNMSKLWWHVPHLIAFVSCMWQGKQNTIYYIPTRSFRYFTVRLTNKKIYLFYWIWYFYWLFLDNNTRKIYFSIIKTHFWNFVSPKKKAPKNNKIIKSLISIFLNFHLQYFILWIHYFCCSSYNVDLLFHQHFSGCKNESIKG